MCQRAKGTIAIWMCKATHPNAYAVDPNVYAIRSLGMRWCVRPCLYAPLRAATQLHADVRGTCRAVRRDVCAVRNSVMYAGWVREIVYAGTNTWPVTYRAVLDAVTLWVAVECCGAVTLLRHATV